MHPNEALVRDGYEAMSCGDGSALARLITPDTRWIIRGEGALAGTYTGSEEIFSFWKLVASKTGGGLRLKVRDVLANDERAVVLVTVSGIREGRSLEEQQIVVFELRDETITSATFVYEQPAVYDEFWS